MSKRLVENSIALTLLVEEIAKVKVTATQACELLGAKKVLDRLERNPAEDLDSAQTEVVHNEYFLNGHQEFPELSYTILDTVKEELDKRGML